MTHAAALALLGLCLTVAGCAPNAERMIAVAAEPAGDARSPLTGTLVMGRVAGEEVTASGLNGRLTLRNADLAAAVTASLARAGYLAADGEAGVFRLNVALVWLEPPSPESEVATAYVLIRYRLNRRADRTPVYEDLITTSCAVTAGEEWNGSSRARHATECAVQRNILALLSALGRAAPPTQRGQAS